MYAIVKVCKKMFFRVFECSIAGDFELKTNKSHGSNIDFFFHKYEKSSGIFPFEISTWKFPSGRSKSNEHKFNPTLWRHVAREPRPNIELSHTHTIEMVKAKLKSYDYV